MNHPIEVPGELFAEWLAQGLEQNGSDKAGLAAAFVARKAAEWAADEELTACCAAIKLAWEMEPVMTVDDLLRELRRIRRPKPLSLKEQARNALEVCVYGDPIQDDKVRAYNTIRRALDALPD